MKLHSETKPLDGILVVSIEQALAAPFATARLAEAGARVIKIERATGDFARGYDKAAKGDSSYFIWTNQGKESVVLDYKTDEDSALLKSIISKADILVQNLAAGAMERAGFGSEEMRNLNPRLITVDISGYGEDPKVSDLKAYDFLVQAESGLVATSGGPGEMGRIGISICDIGTGMTAHAAILEALLLRSRTGKGSALKISLFDVAADWMTVPLIHQEYGKGAPKREGLRHPTMAPYGAYQTAEGSQTLVSVQNEREWQRFCEQVIHRPDLLDDPRFSSNNNRVENRTAMDQQINGTLQQLNTETFIERLRQASIAYGAINSVEQLGEHIALRRRVVHTSKGETLEIPASPIRKQGQREITLIAPPVLGADTEKVRAQFMTQKEIA